MKPPKRERQRNYKSTFSIRGSVMKSNYPNPILYEGSPMSTAGVYSAMALAEAMGIVLYIDAPTIIYKRVWGKDCRNAKTVFGTWNLTWQAENNQSILLSFNLISDDSPPIVGLDAQLFLLSSTRIIMGAVRSTYRVINTKLYSEHIYK